MMRRTNLLFVFALSLGGVIAWGADWLTDGGDPQRTAWQKDEKILTTANVKDMKLLWKIKLDNQPRQMHSLFPPLIVGTGEHPERSEADRDRDRRLRQHLRHRRRKGRGDLEEAFREHLHSAAPAGAAAAFFAPAASDGHAGDRPGEHCRQVHHLRRLLGRHAASVERRRRRGRRAARRSSCRQRQALRAEPVEQRDLHPHRAGLRRQSEHGLHLRPGHQQGRHAGVRRAAACGAAPVPRSVASGVMYTGTATAAGIRRTASTATASSA